MPMNNSAGTVQDAAERFAFGRNWQAYLASIDEERIREAERSLMTMLDVEDLSRRSFVDIGCGSGLFSLAARRLGAQVMSIDFDADAVACTEALRSADAAGDPQWVIAQGSILDGDLVSQLGQFDVVYSWGVLHHTGHLWPALANAIQLVKPGGQLFIAIYNDQGRASRRWGWVKQRYVRASRLGRALLLGVSFLRLWGPTLVRDSLRLHPLRTWRARHAERGMDPWRDMVDWVGGYPFEVAKPEAVFDFCRARGLQMTRMVTCAGGLGCNEFVFERLTGPVGDRASSARSH